MLEEKVKNEKWLDFLRDKEETKAIFDELETVPTWDEWDPDRDRWNYEPDVV